MEAIARKMIRGNYEMKDIVKSLRSHQVESGYKASSAEDVEEYVNKIINYDLG